REEEGKRREALALLRNVLGEEHPQTAISYTGLALCLHAQGKYADALPLFQKSLAICQKVLGEQHPNTATSYTNLASCLDEQGKHAEALPLHRKALAL